MRPVTSSLLGTIAGGGNPALLAALAPELNAQFPAAAIDTPLRLAHFLAQAAYETWSFNRLEEALSYSAARIAEVWPRLAARAEALAHNPEKLANAAYAGINGNGDEASGDGWRYRGRGCFDLTGRANYASAGKLCGEDFVSEPDLVAAPHWAVASAVAFWNERNINLAADADDIARVTKLVTGSEIGLAERTALTARALKLIA